VIVGLLLGDPPRAKQQFDVAVIARAGDDGTGPQLVDAAVADVCPECALAPHEADGAGRARPDFDRQREAERDHRVVRAANVKAEF
jgi:hypothetical protein